MLYYIVSLHQTTTGRVYGILTASCIISFLYIKPQPDYRSSSFMKSCIISFLYIKPQPYVHLFIGAFQLYYIVSLHQTTTQAISHFSMLMLYYIVSLHQTTTVSLINEQIVGCIISFLYIKPQLAALVNAVEVCCIISFLYIKPQPEVVFICVADELYYIVSLHQTTTGSVMAQGVDSCIISFLYIKPQLMPHTQ